MTIRLAMFPNQEHGERLEISRSIEGALDVSLTIESDGRAIAIQTEVRALNRSLAEIQLLVLEDAKERIQARISRITAEIDQNADERVSGSGRF